MTEEEFKKEEGKKKADKLAAYVVKFMIDEHYSKTKCLTYDITTEKDLVITGYFPDKPFIRKGILRQIEITDLSISPDNRSVIFHMVEPDERYTTIHIKELGLESIDAVYRLLYGDYPVDGTTAPVPEQKEDGWETVDKSHVASIGIDVTLLRREIPEGILYLTVLNSAREGKQFNVTFVNEPVRQDMSVDWSALDNIHTENQMDGK